MAGTITTGSVSRLLQEGVKNVFGNELKEHPPKWDKMFKSFKSTKAFEVAVQLEGFGLHTEKNEGDDITFDSRRQGFTPKYIHTTFAKGYIVTREALEDELYNQLDEGARALGRSWRITKEVQGASVYNNGFDSGTVMVDGDGRESAGWTREGDPEEPWSHRERIGRYDGPGIGRIRHDGFCYSFRVRRAMITPTATESRTVPRITRPESGTDSAGTSSSDGTCTGSRAAEAISASARSPSKSHVPQDTKCLMRAVRLG